jgi:hypothetical protein
MEKASDMAIPMVSRIYMEDERPAADFLRKMRAAWGSLKSIEPAMTTYPVVLLKRVRKSKPLPGGAGIATPPRRNKIGAMEEIDEGAAAKEEDGRGRFKTGIPFPAFKT